MITDKIVKKLSSLGRNSFSCGQGELFDIADIKARGRLRLATQRALS